MRLLERWADKQPWRFELKAVYDVGEYWSEQPDQTWCLGVYPSCDPWGYEFSASYEPARLVRDAAEFQEIHSASPLTTIPGFSPWRHLDKN
ncbi:hypothetical protein AK812_SmicGene33101 [Symbiodinium microadriaticum]|uniref:Uncharacterized protein n=1 Tax=Symbiodinium microadriaticum TaxID=2951 RepID=A0A1Q9CSG6_SYMMI|nr:hypothetical protein AK812_SmicGene33101 [Symbiodinium microadriaticum]